ncbi:DUF2330 domain-containing protein [bacterium]|nr:DUF2330 domain-containing protein [bacterium]
MRKFILIMTIGVLFLSFVTSSSADGVMLPQRIAWLEKQVKTLINEPEQKAVIYFNRGEETLIISPRYEGSAKNFAWVIPVPSRPRVEKGDAEIFGDLDRLLLSFRKTVSPVETPINVLEQKTTGDYDVSVLKSTDGNALIQWLDENAYHLPEKASEPVDSYAREGWTFVACKVHDPESAESGLQSGTLTPLKLKFLSRKPVYPLRLSSANPKAFDIAISLILPEGEREHEVKIDGLPDRIANIAHIPMITLDAKQTKYPSLAKLSSARLEIFHQISCRLEPSDCTADLVWNISFYSPPPPLPQNQRLP